MKYVLSLDQGTTSSRAIVFDLHGNIVAQANREISQIYPQPGWIEHDPCEIWQTLLISAREAISSLPDYSSYNENSKLIISIGVTNQRESVVVWNRKTGKPIYNALVWQDRRTASYCEELIANGFERNIRQRTGLVLDSYFSATKIKWLLESNTEARNLALKNELACGTIDSWIVWNLTGGRHHITDSSNASRTMLFNLHSQKWDDQLLDFFEIPRNVLPVVLPSCGHVADTDASVLGKSIPISAIVADQQASAFGQTCFSKGTVKNTYGTGCFMLMNIGNIPIISNERLITTIGWDADRQNLSSRFFLEGSVFMAGGVLQWLRDGIGLVSKAEEVEALANNVSSTGDVFLIPAFAGLGAPHWDSHARGALIGLTRGTNKSHIARAALEAIAFQTVEVFQLMVSSSNMNVTELRVDGGVSKNNLLLQMQADLLGVPVIRPVITEVTALGAAMMAGLAMGAWNGLHEVKELWRSEKTFTPQMHEDQRLEKLNRWSEAIDRAKHWAV